MQIYATKEKIFGKSLIMAPVYESFQKDLQSLTKRP